MPVSAIESLLVTTVTTTCSSAQEVARGYAHLSRCLDRGCSVGAWVCKPVLTGPESRCARPQPPYVVLEITREVVIVD